MEPLSLTPELIFIAGGAWFSIHVHIWYINKRVDRVEKRVDIVDKHILENHNHV